MKRNKGANALRITFNIRINLLKRHKNTDKQETDKQIKKKHKPIKSQLQYGGYSVSVVGKLMRFGRQATFLRDVI